jgi:phosphoribosyl 1,2-cyclic phosphodiesterase
MSGEIFETIRGSRLVLLESNHDVEMVKNGPYPYPLKMRILSDLGHLSNKFAAKVAVRLGQSGTKTLLLAHLSAENNEPRLALDTVKTTLAEAGVEMDVQLAPRSNPGQPILL